MSTKNTSVDKNTVGKVRQPILHFGCTHLTRDMAFAYFPEGSLSSHIVVVLADQDITSDTPVRVQDMTQIAIDLGGREPAGRDYSKYMMYVPASALFAAEWRDITRYAETSRFYGPPFYGASASGG